MYGIKLVHCVFVLLIFQIGANEINDTSFPTNHILGPDHISFLNLEQKLDHLIQAWTEERSFWDLLRVRLETQAQQISAITQLVDTAMKVNTQLCASSDIPPIPPIDIRSGGVIPPPPQNCELQTLPKNCLEARQSFIYQIQLNKEPFFVYCNAHPQESGWTVVLRRKDGSINFYRDWIDYKQGFGNLEGEFFMGLDKLHAITSSQVHELLIVMEDFEGQKRSAKYQTFAIGAEDESYALNVLGKYSGDAGDSLSGHAGQKFTTRDRDNDLEKNNCAKSYMGAWWYTACHNSNLMGQYLKGEYKQDQYAKGVVWQAFRGYNYALKFVEMQIRPLLL